jgi:hypothetical protein
MGCCSSKEDAGTQSTPPAVGQECLKFKLVLLPYFHGRDTKTPYQLGYVFISSMCLGVLALHVSYLRFETDRDYVLTQAHPRIIGESRAVGGESAENRPEDPRAAAAAAAEVGFFPWSFYQSNMPRRKPLLLE